MRLHLSLVGLALILLASGLAACTAPASVTAGQLISASSTATLPPAATNTPRSVPAAPTSTYLPPPTPAHTATAQPTVSQAPARLEPTSVLTPVPIAPPAPDGTLRSADVPILMYHYISAAPSTNDRIRYGLSVTPEMFDAQLKLLQDNALTTITLRDLYEHLAVGRPLPPQPVILTFDDGYIDNYTNAFPILQKYGMTGTFFVLTGPADDGDPTYLSWDMIQEMSRAGMDIQLHSREHFDMRNRPPDWLFFQIIGGRQSIEGHTGKPVIFIAYPSGKYDASVQRFLRDANFWAAVTTVSGRRHVLANALNWDRVRISGQLRLRDFARLLGISSAVQHKAPQPIPAATIITPKPAPTEDPNPIITSTSTRMPPMTQTAPRPTHDGTIYPTSTPFSSPLQTPTLASSPLATPVP